MRVLPVTYGRLKFFRAAIIVSGLLSKITLALSKQYVYAVEEYCKILITMLRRVIEVLPTCCFVQYTMGITYLNWAILNCNTLHGSRRGFVSDSIPFKECILCKQTNLDGKGWILDLTYQGIGNKLGMWIIEKEIGKGKGHLREWLTKLHCSFVIDVIAVHWHDTSLVSMKGLWRFILIEGLARAAIPFYTHTKVSKCDERSLWHKRLLGI